MHFAFINSCSESRDHMRGIYVHAKPLNNHLKNTLVVNNSKKYFQHKFLKVACILKNTHTHTHTHTHMYTYMCVYVCV